MLGSGSERHLGDVQEEATGVQPNRFGFWSPRQKGERGGSAWAGGSRPGGPETATPRLTLRSEQDPHSLISPAFPEKMQPSSGKSSGQANLNRDSATAQLSKRGRPSCGG